MEMDEDGMIDIPLNVPDASLDTARAVPLLALENNDDPFIKENANNDDTDNARLPVFTPRQNKMLWRAAGELYTRMISDLFKTFVALCNIKDNDTWMAIPSNDEDHETLQLHARRNVDQHDNDTSYCMWRVRGRVECPGDHVVKLLSDHDTRSRTQWDETVKSVKIVDTFPGEACRVVQTVYRNASGHACKTNGALTFHMSRYNAVNRTWTVLCRDIDHYYKVDAGHERGPNSGSKRDTWLAVHIRDNHTDAGSCYIDMIRKVWSPPLSMWKRLLTGQRHCGHAETLRQYVHLFERVQERWFYYFPPNV